jgi:short-chain fatty acids transporter
MPDSLVFAILLTFIVALMSLGLTDSGPLEVVRGWGDGLSGLLAFIAQISIVLALGYTLAHTTPIQRLLGRISRLPRSPAAAYGFVTLIAALASLISWGLGLIVGGIMAVEVAKSARERGIRLHYPLLVASAYSGYVVWHMGYSGSGPLAAATEGSFFEDLASPVSVTQTIFAWWNLVAIAVTIIVIIISMMLLSPRGDDPIVELETDESTAEDQESASGEADPQPAGDSPEPSDEERPSPDDKPAPAERLDGARLITLALGVALVAYLIVYFAQEGFNLTLNIVNWSFLAAILLLVETPQKLVALIAGGIVKSCGSDSVITRRPSPHFLPPVLH